MTQRTKRKINWQEWFGMFAARVWIVGTYLGLLAGIAKVASMGTDHPSQSKAVAALAVMFTTLLHWLLFTMIERSDVKTSELKQENPVAATATR